MKKFLLLTLLIVCLVVPSVFSWGADRTVSGNDVTIDVNTDETTGFIIRETIPSGLTVTKASAGSYIGTGYVKWTFTTNPASNILTYSTTGSGIVSGIMTAGTPASQKPVSPATTTITSGGSSSSGSGKSKASLSSASGKVGDTITLTVSVDPAGTAASGGKIIILYDSAELEYVKVPVASYFDSKVITPGTDRVTIYQTSISDSKSTEKGVWAKIQFKIKQVVKETAVRIEEADSRWGASSFDQYINGHVNSTAAKKANGATCSAAADCTSGYCDSAEKQCKSLPLTSTTKVKKGTGESCTSNDGCTSGICDLKEKQCRAKLIVKVDVGETCKTNAECKSNACGSTKKCLGKLGDKCELAENCISQNCNSASNKCVSKAGGVEGEDYKLKINIITTKIRAALEDLPPDASYLQTISAVAKALKEYFTSVK